MVWLWLTRLVAVDALPFIADGGVQRRYGAALDRRNTQTDTSTGEPPRDRTIVTVLSLICMMVLSFLLGSRFTKLRRNALMKRNLTSMLVLLLYGLVILFLISSTVLLSGQGLEHYNLCFAATWVCLIFYTASKGVIYIFLVERVHVVRAPFVQRRRDWLYWGCMAMVIASFVGVSINAYLHPIIEMRGDNRCYMGIPGKVSIPFMVVDIAVDVALTGVFFYLLRPLVSFHGIATLDGVFAANRERIVSVAGQQETAVQKNIRALLWKSVAGSILIMLPTIANMIQFYITKGRELALICLGICVLDVTWDAIVIHWLTFGSVEAEQNLSKSLELSSPKSPTFRPRSLEALNIASSRQAAVPTSLQKVQHPRKCVSGETLTEVRPD
ncbi:hypothetical protein BU24DRAFT_349306 [Aaosphaeria arxii CBS 175.79]|uniref:G-protein coupled receptors family 1 profile domain-containing protein n=1 Tax=Aaosphaeria arxii CBS 175.79 TaxID=1450172 RepID=A0A6A5XMI4_9PLEO|nr:uncharacterized protein BU24DRAFT_349306 [Aaosphaeria arxii CBS 175.79]KAF2014116.1 hypothetical protein BU24DRAFT_349306 [Aaosphaeria arxii CBS 175.79]